MKEKTGISCQICDKSFKTSYKLKRHEKLHIKAGKLPQNYHEQLETKIVKRRKSITPKKPKRIFECKECCKTFEDSWKLRRHENVHVKKEKLNLKKEENTNKNCFIGHTIE